MREEQLAHDAAASKREADDARARVATMRQTFHAAASLELASGGDDGGVSGSPGVGGTSLGPGSVMRDGDATVAALNATSEARIRQLNHKVEFLKASLAAEAQTKESLEATNVKLRAKVGQRTSHEEANAHRAVDRSTSASFSRRVASG